jgi:uncharacterized protein (DUF302 family)|tara:strand:- start:438 stop:962 length:525 start_codon:yes stop_codon:yes gene_type:complete
MQEKMGSRWEKEKVPWKSWTTVSQRAKYQKRNRKNKNERLILKTKKMKYYFNKTLNEDFDKVIEKVTEELKNEGFGILTEIDVKETLKKKLDVDFKKYKILGACNPPYAHKALEAEDKIGTMLPCNVIVQEIEEGTVEVAAVNPMASMQAVENEQLKEVAEEITNRLEHVIDKL